MEPKKNIFEISGDVGIGYLANGGIFLFDSEDYDKIKDCYWFPAGNGYIRTFNKKVVNRCNKSGLLHRFLLGCKGKQGTDHKNHCPADNRKSNIRICTASQNSRNRNFRGYSWDRKTKKWRVQITVNKRNHELGYFEKEEDALAVRRKAEIKYFGEYAFSLPVARKALYVRSKYAQ